MDTQKLTAGETFDSGNANVPETSFLIGGDAGYLVSVASELDENDGKVQDIARELVKRWNMHGEQQDAILYALGKLGSLSDTLPDTENGEDTDDALARCRHIIDDIQAKLQGIVLE